MRLGFGLITCQRHPDDPRSDTDLYRDGIALSRLAEQVGFDSVWLSEHHFLDDGYMPSLLVTAAAVAQATERIGIGTGVLLAPLHDPIRLAEDAATVDLISGGRLILGLGAGWREEEFELFGVGLSERPARIRETVAILRAAWSDDAITFEGRHYRYDRAFVTPKPTRPIPIWLGAFAPAAIKRAGRIADGFLGSSSGTSGIEGFDQARQVALEGLAAAGRDPATFTFALHVPVYCSESANAWDEVRPWYNYLRWKYPDMAGSRGRVGPPTAPPALDDEDRLRSSIVCGSPQQVVDEVGRFRDTLGDDVHFIFRSDFPGMPFGQSTRHVEVLGLKVLPHLR